jgi:predicted DCC family thiol-disulfide oxidoreductase YuxK
VMRVLLYDGLCGFCDRTVQYVLKRDAGGTMRFAPIQGEYARAVLERHPELRSVDSLILVDEEGSGTDGPLVRTDAVLGIAHYLGWPWKAAQLLGLVPRFLRDGAYDLFARHRYRLFGRRDSCPVPDAAVRGRFIP